MHNDANNPQEVSDGLIGSILQSAPCTYFLLFWCFLCGCVCESRAETPFIVSYRSPEVTLDFREAYNIDLIRLALEKTKDKYGDFKMMPLPKMNHLRSLYTVSTDMQPNILLEMSYSDKNIENENLTYINFPIDYGVMGYRICFARREILPQLANVKTLDELRRFTIGQGLGWADVDILRANGLQVTVVDNYESLFKMTSAGRVDLFCRGATEIKSEFEQFRSAADIDFDRTFTLVYRLPRFFFTNRKNWQLKARIEEGLGLAYQDGSLTQLWLKHYRDNIDLVNVKARRKILLKNPFLSSLKEQYPPFLFEKIILKSH